MSCFPCFFHMELYHAGYETNKNKIWSNDKIEPHNTMLHVEVYMCRWEMNFTERFRYNCLLPVETWNKINTFAFKKLMFQYNACHFIIIIIIIIIIVIIIIIIVIIINLFLGGTSGPVFRSLRHILKVTFVTLHRVILSSFRLIQLF